LALKGLRKNVHLTWRDITNIEGSPGNPQTIESRDQFYQLH